jgi:hypothetical protein
VCAYHQDVEQRKPEGGGCKGFMICSFLLDRPLAIVLLPSLRVSRVASVHIQGVATTSSRSSYHGQSVKSAPTFTKGDSYSSATLMSIFPVVPLSTAACASAVLPRV